jgi:hypothetical protein
MCKVSQSQINIIVNRVKCLMTKLDKYPISFSHLRDQYNMFRRTGTVSFYNKLSFTINQLEDDLQREKEKEKIPDIFNEA